MSIVRMQDRRASAGRQRPLGDGNLECEVTDASRGPFINVYSCLQNPMAAGTSKKKSLSPSSQKN